MVAFHDGGATVSADDVLAFALPSGPEVRYGYDAGYIADRDVVALMLARLTAGRTSTAAEETIALLLSDELDRVRDVLPDIPMEERALPQHLRAWQYFIVRSILAANASTGQAEVDDALDSVVATFDYADAVLELLPPPLCPGRPAEEPAARRARQQLWVEIESVWYDSFCAR